MELTKTGSSQNNGWAVKELREMITYIKTKFFRNRLVSVQQQCVVLENINRKNRKPF